MFKKIGIFIILIIIFMLPINKISCNSSTTNEYSTYAAINCNSGKLIKDYTNEELVEKYKTLKNKFRTWSVAILNENIQVDFISEVLYSFYNEGTTPIQYSVDLSEQHTKKTQFSLSGSLKAEISGDIKKIKGGITSKLESSYDFEHTIVTKRQESIKIDVDPQTVCVIYYQGSALVTNGLAKYFGVFKVKEVGTFEIFTITNLNLRIEKVKI